MIFSVVPCVFIVVQYFSLLKDIINVGEKNMDLLGQCPSETRIKKLERKGGKTNAWYENL